MKFFHLIFLFLIFLLAPLKCIKAQESLSPLEIEDQSQRNGHLVITLGRQVEISYQQNPPPPIPVHELHERIKNYFRLVFNNQILPSFLKISCAFFTSCGAILLKISGPYLDSTVFYYIGIGSITLGSALGLGAIGLHYNRNFN